MSVRGESWAFGFLRDEQQQQQRHNKEHGEADVLEMSGDGDVGCAPSVTGAAAPRIVVDRESAALSVDRVEGQQRIHILLH